MEDTQSIEDLFSDPFSLIQHARNLLKEFQRNYENYMKGNLKEYWQRDEQAGQDVLKVRIVSPRPPPILTHILKDAAANLRDALDYAVYAATAALNGGEPENTAFPFGKDRNEVKKQLERSGKLKDIPQELHPLLLSFDSYDGGDPTLLGLYRLRNRNAHRRLVKLGTEAVNTFLMIESSDPSKATEFPDSVSKLDPKTSEIVVHRGPIGQRRKPVRGNVRFSPQLTEDFGFGEQGVVEVITKSANAVERIVHDIRMETGRLRELATTGGPPAAEKSSNSSEQGETRPDNRRRIVNRSYASDRIKVDDVRFKSCKFDRCSMVYHGGSFEFNNCTFSSCTWSLEGNAQHVLAFLAWFYALHKSYKEMVAITFHQISGGDYGVPPKNR